MPLVQGVLTLPQAKYSTPEQTYAFYTQLAGTARRAARRRKRRRRLDAAALSVSHQPRNYLVEGREPPPAGREPLACVNGVTPSFLDTLEIKLHRRPEFHRSRHAHRPLPSRSSTRRWPRALFPDENPIGRRIGGPDPDNRGLGRDRRRHARLAIAPWSSPRRPRVSSASPARAGNVELRRPSPSARPLPETLVESMRRAIAELDPDLAVQQLDTVDQMIERGTGGLSMINTILSPSRCSDSFSPPSASTA